jgi:hypothetical protein
MSRILAIAVVSAAVMACGVSGPASARDDGAVAAGVLGGLAVGAIIGSQAAQPQRNYYGGPGYANQPVVYERREMRECHIEREQVVDQYGYVHNRRIQVCD